MSGVLHPVGPESAQIYWARRALVFGAATVLAVAVMLIISGTSSGLATQPKPSAADNPVPAAAAARSASPSGLDTAMLTPSRVDLPAAATSTTPVTGSPKPTASAGTKGGPADCPAEELRPTLTGKQRLAAHERNTFHLSLINGSDHTCIARVTRKNFELTISSGSDRIWSTDDCRSTIEPISRKLGSEHAVAWSLTWDAKRSKSNCRSAQEALRPGTYLATAKLDGAEPVQLRMQLVD
jgi:hypothetical protein